MMVVMLVDKNPSLSFGREMTFKKVRTINKTNYNVKLDVYKTDGDVLCVEIMAVDEEYRG